MALPWITLRTAYPTINPKVTFRSDLMQKMHWPYNIGSSTEYLYWIDSRHLDSTHCRYSGLPLATRCSPSTRQKHHNDSHRSGLSRSIAPSRASNLPVGGGRRRIVVFGGLRHGGSLTSSPGAPTIAVPHERGGPYDFNEAQSYRCRRRCCDSRWRRHCTTIRTPRGSHDWASRVPAGKHHTLAATLDTVQWGWLDPQEKPN